MILEKDTRKLFLFSLLFTIYIVIGALVFQALEIGNEIEERSLMKATRAMLNEKYNISDKDWDKLKIILKQKNSLDANPTWSFGNAFIFAGSVITTVGKWTDVTVLPLTFIAWILNLLQNIPGNLLFSSFNAEPPL